MATDKTTRTETTPHGEATITKDGDKLIITIPNPKNKSIEEIDAITGHSCHERCAGLISNAVAFVV